MAQPLPPPSSSPPPPIAKNAWSTPLRVPTSHNKIRLLLNKICPENFDKLTPQAKQLLSQANNSTVAVFFSHAISTCSLYSEMYVKLTKFLTPPMQKYFVQLCQEKFQTINLQHTEEERLNFYKETDEILLKFIDSKLLNFENEHVYTYWCINVDERVKKLDQERIGLITLLSHLYMYGIISEYVLHVRILQAFLKNIGYVSIDYLDKMLPIVGKNLSENRGKMLDDYFEILTNVYLDDKRLDSRSKCLILNLIQLRENNWKQKSHWGTPMTLDEVKLVLQRS